MFQTEHHCFLWNQKIPENSRALFGGGICAKIDSTVELAGTTEISYNRATCSDVFTGASSSLQDLIPCATNYMYSTFIPLCDAQLPLSTAQ